jgi:hypothetical protein
VESGCLFYPPETSTERHLLTFMALLQTCRSHYDLVRLNVAIWSSFLNRVASLLHAERVHVIKSIHEPSGLNYHRNCLVKRFSAVLLIALGLGCSFFYAGLIVHYSNVLPRTPQPQLGRIYPINNHGTVVYLTEHEQSELTWLSFAALGFGISGGVLFASTEKKG